MLADPTASAPKSVVQKYLGFAFRQSPDPKAPWLVSFVAAAEDILTWAGIPRRTETATMGFQRVDDDARVLRTKEFFQLPPNQSPTALIVGIHPQVDKVSPDISLNFLSPPSATESSVPCELTINIDCTRVSIDEAVSRLKKQLTYRLESDTSPTASDQPDADETAVDDDEEGGETDADDTSESEGIELTHSLVHKLLKQLDDPEWVQNNSETILDLAKPATVIDGQHRIKGAALCERRIPFIVCALFDCGWPEQVFQFTVVNYSAKGIPDQFITANAALSLTEGELGDLRLRLTQARVKVIEYELMKVVHFDDQSPFFGCVNLSEGSDPTKIGYKTMVKIAREWYSARNTPLKHQLLPNLFPKLKGRGAPRQRERDWQDEHWGHFFIDFWKVVRDHYRGHVTEDNNSLWTIGSSNLMIAIVLLEFQKTFFMDLNNQDDEFFQVPANEEPIEFLRSKLRQRATKFLSFFPADFFATPWATKSLNTSAGRVTLQSALDKLLKTKGKYQYGKSPLVTGEIG